MPERLTYPALSLTAQSLIDAFSRGEVFSPDYFAAWLKDGRAEGKPFIRPILQEASKEEGETAPAVVIDAETVRRALLGRLPDAHGHPIVVDERGARIVGVTITDALDLQAIEFEQPIEFKDCIFTSGILFLDAKLGRVSLDGSRVQWVMGDMAKIRGDLSLKRLRDCARVDLDRAEISGLLTLQGTALAGEGDAALSCNGTVIDGSVHLRDGFNAGALVNFVGAKIGGYLECSGGIFKSEDGVALNCNGARIGAHVFMDTRDRRKPFSATGGVDFGGASIGGQLSCVGGTLSNDKGPALDCNAARIGQSVFLRDGFCVTGEVSFIRAEVGGYFHCQEGVFAAGLRGTAVDLIGARIGATLFLTKIKSFTGELDLRDARVHALADDGSLWSGKRKGEVTIHLDRFHYDTFADDDVYHPTTRTDLRARTRLGWLRMQPKVCVDRDFRPQPFTQCAKVLRSMGHTEDARAILFWREKLRMRRPDLGWVKRFFFTCFGFFAGYGYKRSRALGYVFIIWVLGALIYWVAETRGLIRPAADEVLASEAYRAHQTLPPDYEPFKPWLYSADALIPLADFAQERFWLPRDGGEKAPGFDGLLPQLPSTLWARVLRGIIGWIPKLYYLFQMAAGWLLITVLVAGFTRHIGYEKDE